VLERAGDPFKKATSLKLGAEGTEVDLEGLAGQGDVLYAVGSHSLARKQPDADKSYQKNRLRIMEVNEDANRDQLFRLKLDAEGQLAKKDSINLRPLVLQHSLLRPFARLPSKENGIDIEGVAADNGTLYFGFRGPVLRGNYVPIVALEYDRPDDYRLLFVDLAGRGIRDLAAVAGGLLVLAGPVGDGDGSHELYFWNKLDCVPGDGSPQGKVTRVGTIRSTDTAKPEGIAIVEESHGIVRFLLLCDGAPEPSVERLRISIPRL
jgi:hypothetical protein